MKIFTSFFSFIKKYRFIIISTAVVFAVVGGIEYLSGRSLLGPDGQFGWWDNNIWGNETSQRVADVYSFSHIIHGMLFYGFLWFVWSRLPERLKNKFPRKWWFLIALLIEGGWELLENSPIIIDRYRSATIALGYTGDSVLNSVCDVGMMAIGFLMARFFRVSVIIVLILVFELGALFWVRDNLTLNILQLIYPSQAIKEWQSEGH
ncbi:MAG: DUF2585 family protein [Candidatus Taylorbacteria bacterium]|nr:DUF2585 family protein [Candidatus Taylorbacteria bacterium]